MKHVSEYRDASMIRALSERIRSLVDRPIRIMEVCGGQTNTILRYGLDQCLGPDVTFLHGPGCPVCVTPISTIDFAQKISLQPSTILCTFGDMMRVPGSSQSLAEAKSRGGQVVALYSPLDALEVARNNPDSQVVLFAIGFETTAPLTALAVLQAEASGLSNFSVLCAHVLIPPAIEAVLRMPSIKIDALLAPGHVCAVTGTESYDAISASHKIPIVVTGFEPVDILQGALKSIEMLKAGDSRVSIQYSRAVDPHGNMKAQRLIDEVFRVSDREWRGLGEVPASGLRLASRFAKLDAALRFADVCPEPIETRKLPCADVLTGRLSPRDCRYFGNECVPETPLGAPMVSAEGACAAHYHARAVRSA